MASETRSVADDLIDAMERLSKRADMSSEYRRDVPILIGALRLARDRAIHGDENEKPWRFCPWCGELVRKLSEIERNLGIEAQMRKEADSLLMAITEVLVGDEPNIVTETVQNVIDLKSRAEKAEADVERKQTKILNQQAEIKRLRAEHEASIQRCATAERRVWELEHQASPPAPSGWQQRIADAFAAGMRVRSVRLPGAEIRMPCPMWREGDIKAAFEEWWQNAKDALPSEEMIKEKTRDDLGLAIDMLDSDRLRQWAENLDTYGNDISHWADRRFVIEKLRDFAGRIETTVREIGTLRELVAKDALPPAPEASPARFCECIGVAGHPNFVRTQHGRSVCVHCDLPRRADASPAKETS